MKQNITFITTIFILVAVRMAEDVASAAPAPGSVEESVQLGKIETYWREFDKGKVLSVDDVINNQYCLGDPKHSEGSDFLESFGEDFNAFILSHLHDAITPNKRYYVHMKGNRRLMYFRQASTYFLHLLSIGDNGDEHIIVRYFYDDSLNGCIKSLPDSCKFQGKQEVSLERMCKVGSNIGKNLVQDFVNISTTASSEDASFVEIINAFDECYKPICYAIPFECMKHSLKYDPNEVRQQLQKIVDQINSDENQNLNAYVVPQNLTIKYSGTLRTLKRDVSP